MTPNLTVQVVNKNKITGMDLYQIAQQSFEFGSPWSVEQFDSLLEQSFILIVMAQIDKEKIGFIMGSATSQDAEIYNIAVKQDYKNKHVGSELMNEFKRNLFLNQINDLFLEVRQSNITAQRFYKKNGFDIIGTRKGYYSNPKEDAIVLKFSI